MTTPSDLSETPPPVPGLARRVLGVADDGSAIAVDLADDQVAAELDRIWPPVGLRRGVVDRDPIAAVAFSSVEDSLRIESDLSLFAAERLHGAVAIHAAVLVWDGRAVVLPGASHAGKTSLALAASAAGAVVASDEYALIDLADGSVTGWVRPLHVRRPGGVDRVPLAEHVDPASVAVVADLVFGAGSPPSIRRGSSGEAAAALLANAVCGSSRPADAFRAAVLVARGARFASGTRGEAADTVELLRTLALDEVDLDACGPGPASVLADVR